MRCLALVVVPAITILAGFQALSASDRQTEALKKEIARLEEALKKEQRKRAHALGYVSELCDFVGFPITEPTEHKPASYKIDRDRVEECVKAHLKRLAGGYVVEVSSGNFPVPSGKNQVSRDGMYAVGEGTLARLGLGAPAEGHLKITPLHPGAVPSMASLESVLSLYRSACERMLREIERLAK